MPLTTDQYANVKDIIKQLKAQVSAEDPALLFIINAVREKLIFDKMNDFTDRRNDGR
jgi:hypothetical protein